MKVFPGIILILFLNTICNAQIDTNTTTGKKVIFKIHQLKDENINTIACYYVECSSRAPRVIMPDSCASYNIVYILWENKHTFFIQKFDGCKTYRAVHMDPMFLQIVKKHLDVILKEKIYPPEYVRILNGKPLVYSLSQDHTCHTIFEIYMGSNYQVAGLNNFEVETKYINGRHLNRNYYRNQKTFLNKLKLIAEKETLVLNKAVN